MVKTLEEASQNRLAGILEGYLREEKWATDRRLEGEVFKSHSIETLKKVISSERFHYLQTINPLRFDEIKKKFEI